MGANLIFLGVSAALYLFPSWGVVFYPLFTLIFFWTDFRSDEELQAIFIFMTMIVALVLISQLPDNAMRIGLLVEMLALLLACFLLGMHRGRLAKERRRILGKVQELDSSIRDMDRDSKFYNTFEARATDQIQFRRDLTEAAKSLGTTLDPQEVQKRLLRILEHRYPGTRAHILPGQPSDPLVNWAVETKAPVLVKDLRTDERFAQVPQDAFRSAVVVPLKVMRRPYGFLRLENERPAAFQAEDLRTVDLFATLASLTLENIRFFENVNDLALHDALTQLYTHRSFQARLQDEILLAGRSQTPLSLVMGDVDHFKHYNDTYGHQAGDFLLRTVAGILTNLARPVDFTARYGGEEFCVILPGCGHPQAMEFAERLRLRIEQEPFVFQGQRTGVTMSFGVSSFPQDATTSSQLVRTADERLYRAKHGGRNRVVG